MGTTVNDVYTPLFDDNVNISFHVFVKKAIRTFDPFFRLPPGFLVAKNPPGLLGRQHKSCMHLTANQRAINALRFRIEEFINLLMYYMFDALVVKNRRL